MNLYIRHAQLVKHLDAAIKLREAILQKKIEILENALPKGVDFSYDRVKKSITVSPFDVYVEMLEKNGIDEKMLDENRAIVNQLYDMVQLAERDLRKSQHVHDKFYVLRVIEKRPMWQIEKRMCYSHAQAWRIWKIIKKNL